VAPEDLSDHLQLAQGTLCKGGDLTHLQPWENRPNPYKFSNQNSVHARVTFQDCLRFVASHYGWTEGRHYVYYFLQNNPHHNLFKQLYVNGGLPSPSMKGEIAMFACAPAHVLPSGCIQVDLVDGEVTHVELLNDIY
jgi:hypothetical protein